MTADTHAQEPAADKADERRRSRLKVLGLAALFIAASIGLRMGVWVVSEFLSLPIEARWLLTGAVVLAAAVAATVWLVRKWPRWTDPDLDLLPRIRGSLFVRSAAATLAGAGLFAAVFGLALATGALGVRWRGPDWPLALGMAGVVFTATVLSAAWEEYTFRGWAFSTCVRAFGPHAVALSVGVLFGLAHLLNPDWTGAAILSVSLAGFLLCYTMLAFRSIDVVIGLHVGWNMAQSLLTSGRFWEKTQHENPLVSGGRYGLEGSLVGIIVTAAAAACVFVLFLRRRNKPPGADPPSLQR